MKHCWGAPPPTCVGIFITLSVEAKLDGINFVQLPVREINICYFFFFEAKTITKSDKVVPLCGRLSAFFDNT